MAFLIQWRGILLRNLLVFFVLNRMFLIHGTLEIIENSFLTPRVNLFVIPSIRFFILCKSTLSGNAIQTACSVLPVIGSECLILLRFAYICLFCTCRTADVPPFVPCMLLDISCLCTCGKEGPTHLPDPNKEILKKKRMCIYSLFCSFIHFSTSLGGPQCS